LKPGKEAKSNISPVQHYVRFHIFHQVYSAIVLHTHIYR